MPLSRAIPDGSITLAKLATDSVDATKIAANAVGTSELASGAVAPAKLADLASLIGVPFLVRAAFSAGGGGADDVVLFSADCPRKVRIVEITCKVTTGVASATLQLRDATGGVGSTLSNALSCATSGTTARLGNAGDATIAANGTLVGRRNDNTTAGILYVWLLPEP